MEDFASAYGIPFAQIPPDPAELIDILETPFDGPRFLEIQVL
jgi:hypothetical protein